MGTIYRNGQKFAGTGSSTANKVILSSALHIGGETQTNAEDAVHALSESGGASSIADLSNVDIKNPQDGDTLYYDSINFIWTNHLLKIVTWANGSDEEIAAMLAAHYNGDINIYDYWNVGDERTISLSAMAVMSPLNDFHIAQNIIMVLMNKGNKTLVTPINGHEECAFIVGQKDYLEEGGWMNSSNTSYGSWDSCLRRTWCNSIYKNAFPNTLIGIFKQHQNITSLGHGGHNTAIISNDYFALPSEKEVLGNTKNANEIAETNNKQFEYYEISANRNKKAGTSSGSFGNWWLRSPQNGSYENFCRYYNDSYPNGGGSVFGLAPFGVI